MSVSAEIIAVGNELLLGIVQDTNTHWLCVQITGLGGHVQRCSIVRDELDAIGDAVKRAVEDQRDLLILTGGLGPTDDDRTLEALAQALEVPLEENPQALNMLTKLFRRLADAKLIESGELTKSRRKMAQLPKGAIPLVNRVGVAPGALMQLEESIIVALPGVPSEMKDIFENALQPYLKRLFGKASYAQKTLIVELNDESRIAPLLKELQDSWPEVYIKSRPKSFEEGFKILITLAMSGEQAFVLETLERVSGVLRERLTREGFASHSA
jgi:molybdenum cofactor synthesis domain-containing protein